MRLKRSGHPNAALSEHVAGALWEHLRTHGQLEVPVAQGAEPTLSFPGRKGGVHSYTWRAHKCAADRSTS
jgi:hypothetical protein